MDPRIIAISNRTGMTYAEAEAWYAKKLDERIAAADAREAEIAAHEAAIADQGIDARTITKITRKYNNGINKNQRADWRRVLGARWERFANPQTRDEVLAGLTQLEGETLLSFRNH